MKAKNINTFCNFFEEIQQISKKSKLIHTSFLVSLVPNCGKLFDIKGEKIQILYFVLQNMTSVLSLQLFCLRWKIYELVKGIYYDFYGQKNE